MRILFLDQFSDLGGAQLCLLDLLPAIEARGWEAVVAAPGNGPLLERCARAEPLRFGPYRSGAKGPADYLRFAWDVPAAGRRIAKLLERHAIDLLYVNGPRMLAPAVWARGGRPVIFHCHSLIAAPAEAAMVRWWLRRAGASVIVNSRWVQRALGDAECTLIYNGVADRSASPEASPSGRLTAGVVGRIGPEKGQAEFVRAARLVLDSGLNCRFVIAGAARPGDASSEAYEKRVRELAAGLPVEFSGWVDNPFPGLDLLVVPSSANEATTRVIPEAFSAALPVLAVRAGGIPEIVEHGKTGLLADSNAPEVLAAALTAALRMPREELQAMGRRSRQAWQERFRLDLWQSQVTAAITARFEKRASDGRGNLNA